MREDIKLKRFRKIYKEVNDNYCNNYENVKVSCNKVGITPSTYYKICKELGKRSVGTSIEDQKVKQMGGKRKKKNVYDSDSDEDDTKRNKKDTSKMNSKRKRVKNQTGGGEKSKESIYDENEIGDSAKGTIERIKRTTK